MTARRTLSTWSVTGRVRDERGSMAIEAVIATPAFILLVAMIIAGGRVQLARQGVEAAAYEAARAASIERTQADAGAVGRTAAQTSLSNQGLRCTSTDVIVNTAAFDAPLGTTGQVTATVTCHVDLSDLSLPGVPGSRIITETASSPVDAYREKAGGFTNSDDVAAGNSGAGS